MPQIVQFQLIKLNNGKLIMRMMSGRLIKISRLSVLESVSPLVDLFGIASIGNIQKKSNQEILLIKEAVKIAAYYKVVLKRVIDHIPMLISYKLIDTPFEHKTQKELHRMVLSRNKDILRVMSVNKELLRRVKQNKKHLQQMQKAKQILDQIDCKFYQ
eukprot:7210_1